MISLIGNIKIANDRRFQYLLCTLKSFYFAKSLIEEIHINIENLDSLDKQKLDKTLQHFQKYQLYNRSGNFGSIYSSLLNKINTKYFMHFEEDHFCVLDDVSILNDILQLNFDLCRSTFYYIEKQCSQKISPIEKYKCGNIYTMTKDNWRKFSKPYGYRYYIGNNSIFDLKFGTKYWSRNISGNRPHVFEVPSYNQELEHTMFIPNQEILCAIDDDHGEPNTCLINRKESKFNALHN